MFHVVNKATLAGRSLNNSQCCVNSGNVWRTAPQLNSSFLSCVPSLVEFYHMHAQIQPRTPETLMKTSEVLYHLVSSSPELCPTYSSCFDLPNSDLCFLNPTKQQGSVSFPSLCHVCFRNVLGIASKQKAWKLVPWYRLNETHYFKNYKCRLHL